MNKTTYRRAFLAALLAAALALTSLPALADTTATVVAASAQVWSSPVSSSARLLGTLKKGAQVVVRGVSGGVAKVTVSGKTGYMDASRLSSAAAQSGSSTTAPAQTAAPSTGASGTVKAGAKAYVAVDRLIVYKSASTSAGTYGTLLRNASVTVLALRGDWAAVSVSGKTGYCAATGLSATQSASTGTASPTPAPTTASGSGTTGTVTVKAGDTAAATQALKLYKSASTSAGSYGTIRVGGSMTVTAVKGQWARVTCSGKTGYVLAAGLEKTTASSAGTQTSSSGATHKAITAANIYEKPSTSAKVIKTVVVGQQIAVKQSSGGWLKLTVNGQTGYALDADFIELGSKSTGMVIAKTASVYASPSLSAAVSGTIAEGASIDLYAVSGSWAKVVFNGRKGYVLTSKLVVGPAAYSALRSGDSGTAVRTLQDRLEELGYFDGIPGGNYGAITTAAVKRFQTQMGLTVTGTANSATLNALYSDKAQASSILSASLTSGSKGDAVTRLQTRLLYKGYFSGSVDGSYGSTTVSAVKAFQKNAGISQTGKANSATIRALFASSAPQGSGDGTKPSGSNGSKSLAAPNVTSDNEDIETVIRWALAQLGKPYRYGTAGPDTFDCSGLTYFCYKKVGITLPRSAYDVGYSTKLGERIAYEDLRRGDVVCFNTIADSDLSDHVGIYLGDGLFIHAPHTGSDVLIASMTSGYYLRNFSWARRPIQ